MKHGIAPLALASQVASTAAWALEESHGEPTTLAVRTIRDAARIEEAWKVARGDLEYLRLLLSAHYLTVATFCPRRGRTYPPPRMVDMHDPDVLVRAVDELDAIAALDPRLVSARVLTGGTAGPGLAATLSGHDGEWFSVLSAATILAHNLGDLSRVVEAWPKRAKLEVVRERYLWLGHPKGRSMFGGAFHVAGAINKSVMAIENHRFLPPRVSRALRRSRALVLPIGPFFYEWSKTIARSFEEEERAEVVTALLETHVSRTEQTGVLRAIVGIAVANAGPWTRLTVHLPVRPRKVVTVGPVQARIGTPERAFRARRGNRYHAALREARAEIGAPVSVSVAP